MRMLSGRIVLFLALAMALPFAAHSATDLAAIGNALDTFEKIVVADENLAMQDTVSRSDMDACNKRYEERQSLAGTIKLSDMSVEQRKLHAQLVERSKAATSSIHKKLLQKKK